MSTLNTLRTENRNKLEEEIGKAELLLAQIVESEDRKDLSEAVNHAKDVFNELPLILSVYTEEAANWMQSMRCLKIIMTIWPLP